MASNQGSKNVITENTNFATEFNGFKKSQVNMYISAIKKKLAEVEQQYAELEIEKNRLSSLVNHDDDGKYETQIRELKDEIKREKEASSNVEKECIRLQSQIDTLNYKLAQKASEEDELQLSGGKKEIFGAELSKRLDKLVATIGEIKQEFVGNDSGFQYNSDFMSGFDSSFEVAEDLSEAAEEPAEQTEDAKKNETEADTDLTISASLVMNDDSESDLNNSFINSAKATATDDFEQILSEFSKESKQIGEDLIAENPLNVSKGDDLEAINPLLVEKGEDLGGDLYEMRIEYDGAEEDNISVDTSNLSLSSLGFGGEDEDSGDDLLVDFDDDQMDYKASSDDDITGMFNED